MKMAMLDDSRTGYEVTLDDHELILFSSSSFILISTKV